MLTIFDQPKELQELLEELGFSLFYSEHEVGPGIEVVHWRAPDSLDVHLDRAAILIVREAWPPELLDAIGRLLDHRREQLRKEGAEVLKACSLCVGPPLRDAPLLKTCPGCGGECSIRYLGSPAGLAIEASCSSCGCCEQVHDHADGFDDRGRPTQVQCPRCQSWRSVEWDEQNQPTASCSCGWSIGPTTARVDGGDR